MVIPGTAKPKKLLIFLIVIVFNQCLLLIASVRNPAMNVNMVMAMDGVAEISPFSSISNPRIIIRLSIKTIKISIAVLLQQKFILVYLEFDSNKLEKEHSFHSWSITVLIGPYTQPKQLC